MSSFGGKEPRSLDSFGVSGLLGPEAQVFYNAIFNTTHTGRISDLLAARLKRSGLSEINLRTLIIFGVFQAYQSQLVKQGVMRIFSKHTEDSLDTPVLLECGIDKEKLALGLCFNLNKKLDIKLEGLINRVLNKQPGDSFEDMLVGLYGNSNKIFIKFQQKTRRMEVVSLVGIEGKMDDMALETKHAPELILIERDDVKPAPKAKIYVDLGDVAYETLLQQSSQGKDAPAEIPSSGEVLMPEATLESVNEVPLEKRKVSPAKPPKEEESQVVAGDPQSQSFTQKVADSQVSSADNTTIVVSGGPAPVNAMETIIVRGKAQEQGGGGFFGKVKRGLTKFYGLARNGGQDDGVPGAPQSSSEVPSGEERNQEGDFVSDEDLVEKEVDPATLTGAVAAELGNPEGLSKKLMFELRMGSMDRLLRGVQKEVDAMGKDSKNPVALVQWSEELLVKLKAEKASLYESARKMNLALRVKEIGHEKEVTAIKEELKAKELQLVARETALNRSSEQLALVTAALENAKKASLDSKPGESFYTQKYSVAQKMIGVAKAENSKLIRKVDELTAQLEALQGKGVPTQLTGLDEKLPGEKVEPALQTEEYAALKVRFERTQKQAEEFKKANRQLMEHLITARKQRAAASSLGHDVSELNRRLEAAVKLATTHRKEVEILKRRNDGLKSQEEKLRLALSEMKKQLIRAKGAA